MQLLHKNKNRYWAYWRVLLWLWAVVGLILSTIISVELSAQSLEALPLPTRFEWWTGIDLRADLGKKCQTTLSFQVRSDDNYTQSPDQIFGELSFNYQLTQFMDLLGSYRYIYRPTDNPTHRLFSGFRFNYRLKPFDLSARALLQTDLTPNKPEQFTPRLQLSAQYDRKKNPLKPRIATELFYRFDYKYRIFSRYRLIGSLAYMPRKTPHAFSLSYIYERNLNIGIPNATHILSVEYRYDLGNLLPQKNDKKKNKTL